MKLKYYGTAAAEGWPGLFCRCDVCEEARRRRGKNIRTRSQAAVDDTLLIDFPPDTYLHTLYGGLYLPKFKNCLITHPHEDHLYVEELGMRAPGFCKDLIPGPFTLYGSDSMAAYIERLPERKRKPEIIRYQVLNVFEPVEVEGYTVTPFKAYHGFHETPPLNCYFYSIAKDGKCLLYAHDTGHFPEETWNHLKGKHFDMISLDCTTLRFPCNGTHMGISDVLETKKRLLEIGCADKDTIFVINHFSHNGEILHEELEEMMKPEGILVAYDGLEIVF